MLQIAEDMAMQGLKRRVYDEECRAARIVCLSTVLAKSCKGRKALLHNPSHRASFRTCLPQTYLNKHLDLALDEAVFLG